MDCMDALRQMPDKAFDLVVADPPYGIEKAHSAPSRISKYGNMQVANDDKPGEEYFKEIFRVSKNQIIWGYNHLSDMLPTTKEFIFWYKHQPLDTYSDGELAWTSFKKTARCIDIPFFGGGVYRRNRTNSSNTETGCFVCMDFQPLRQTGQQNTGYASWIRI